MDAAAEKNGADVNSNVVTSSTGEAMPYIDPAAEKKLLRKMDLYLAPLMTIICKSPLGKLYRFV
jgi:hypothetical protein